MTGGTDADKAPPIDYFIHVFLPLISRIFGSAVDVDVVLGRRGYYPRGGGVVYARTFPISRSRSVICDAAQSPTPSPSPSSSSSSFSSSSYSSSFSFSSSSPSPSSLPPFTMTERGHVIRVTVRAIVSNLPFHIAQRMAVTAEARLKSYFSDMSMDVPISTVTLDESHVALSSGASLILTAETSTGCIFGSTGLGEKGRKSEDIAEGAASQLIQDLESGGCVDEYFQDQIILYMALAAGKSSFLSGPLSLHTRTAIHFAAVMTGANFDVTPIPKRKIYPHKETGGEGGKEREGGEREKENAEEGEGGGSGDECVYLITCHGIGFRGRESQKKPKSFTQEWPPVCDSLPRHANFSNGKEKRKNRKKESGGKRLKREMEEMEE